MEVVLVKKITIVLALLLLMVPCLPAAAGESPVISDELLGTWTGNLAITEHYSASSDTSWIAAEEVKTQTVSFQWGSESGKLYCESPIVSTLVTLGDGGTLDGYEHETIQASDTTYETDYYVSGTVSRNNSGLHLVLEITMDSVTSYTYKTDVRKNKFTYTYTLTPVNPAPVTTEEPVEFGSGQEKATVSYIQGKATIIRNARIFDVSMSDSLLAGDVIVMDEGEMIINGINGGILRIVGRTRFELPAEEKKTVVSPDSLTAKIQNIWEKTIELLRGESFEVKTPTGTCGVRG